MFGHDLKEYGCPFIETMLTKDARIGGERQLTVSARYSKLFTSRDGLRILGKIVLGVWR
jgi:hypothetical protein